MKSILKYPVVTEKTATLQAASNQYTFVVESSANKIQIKKAVQALKDGLVVEAVQTQIVRGKVKRVGRSMGKRSNVKKAVVRLKQGQTIELFDAAV